MKGFDCNSKLTLAKALEFKRQGYEFAVRYVGREKMAAFDLDKVEVNNILKAGLKLLVVQHVKADGWVPTKVMGESYGINAAAFASTCGVRSGTSLYLDLEGIKKGTPKKDIIDYCNAWYEKVLAGGYTPGIYIGYNVWLTGDELYTELKFQHYWKSFSKVPDVTTRGYEMVQEAETTVNDIDIDPDEAGTDTLGNSPAFMEPTRVLLRTIDVYNNGDIEVKEA